jgi:hypothetical protein
MVCSAEDGAEQRSFFRSFPIIDEILRLGSGLRLVALKPLITPFYWSLDANMLGPETHGGTGLHEPGRASRDIRTKSDSQLHIPCTFHQSPRIAAGVARCPALSQHFARMIHKP